MEQYSIQGRIGEGAHGIVFKAKHIEVSLCDKWLCTKVKLALLTHSQSWNSQIFPEVQNLGSCWGAVQIEVQFSGAPMIRHSNMIWGYKNLNRSFAPAYIKMNRSYLLFEWQIAMRYKKIPGLFAHSTHSPTVLAKGHYRKNLVS